MKIENIQEATEALADMTSMLATQMILTHPDPEKFVDEVCEGVSPRVAAVLRYGYARALLNLDSPTHAADVSKLDQLEMSLVEEIDAAYEKELEWVLDKCETSDNDGVAFFGAILSFGFGQLTLRKANLEKASREKEE